MTRSQQGSAVAEACATAALACFVVSGTLSLAYFCWARTWTEHVAYEAAVCAAATSPGLAPFDPALRGCERRLRSALASGLPIGTVLIAKAQRSQASASAEVKVAIAERLTARSHREISLPLPAQASPSWQL